MPDAVKSQESETFLPSASSDCNSDSSANNANNASKANNANNASKANNAELRFEHWGYRHASRRAFAVRGLDLSLIHI